MSIPATAFDLLFYDILAPKKILSKFLMTLLRVICGLVPPNQKFWLRLCHIATKWLPGSNNHSGKIVLFCSIIRLITKSDV